MMKFNRKSTVYLFFISLSLSIFFAVEFGAVALADNGGDESAGVLIKGFDFVRAGKPKESATVIALKRRLR
jgi:hypothetical protein